ncbi:conserved hypothetical protein [Ricinus communis]|uniref:Uncharacterized protein n=1 Tax=Ricinus communis TaxID=3988 RepID=B9RY74_RICCO|nr:conserved hypothetical protein [Ricinus communis]
MGPVWVEKDLVPTEVAEAAAWWLIDLCLQGTGNLDTMQGRKTMKYIFRFMDQ